MNVVGRYAVVKHCPVECCAPASKIADKLNEHRLGASVNEAFGEERSDDDDGVSYLEITHAFVVFALFIVGVIVQEVAVDGAYASMIIFLISTALGLLPEINAAYISLTRFTLDIHVLMIVATVGAIADREYLDSSLLMSLFVVAELIEDFVMVRVGRAVRLNTGSMPKRAVLSSGKSIPLEEVQVGDILAVRAGEMILADGSVLKGESVVDESALTGEAKPLPKKKGDKVSSGTIVQNGYLEVTVEAKPSDSTMNKLRDAVLDVQADKGEYGRMVDRISVYWTPGILFSALCLAVIGGGVTSQWNDYAMKALVLLVLACPCALVVAAPIPSVCSIAAAARKNVLVRGSSVIEKAGLVTTVALDKTGTLTKGFFKVTNKLILPICSDEGYDPVELAAAVEERSAHPLASAIVAECCGCVGEMAELKLSLPKVSKVKVLDGAGLEGWVEQGTSSSDWRHVAIGNERLLKSGGGKAMVDSAMLSEIKDFEAKFRNSSIVYICVDDQLSAILALSGIDPSSISL